VAYVIGSLADQILELERFIEVSNSAAFDVVKQQRNVNAKWMTDSHLI
jgi:hypothetical protein